MAHRAVESGAPETDESIRDAEKKAAESAKDTDAELKEQTKILTTIKEEIQKNP